MPCRVAGLHRRAAERSLHIRSRLDSLLELPIFMACREVRHFAVRDFLSRAHHLHVSPLYEAVVTFASHRKPISLKLVQVWTGSISHLWISPSPVIDRATFREQTRSVVPEVVTFYLKFSGRWGAAHAPVRSGRLPPREFYYGLPERASESCPATDGARYKTAGANGAAAEALPTEGPAAV